MKRILPCIAALVCTVALAACQAAPDSPPLSLPESQAPAPVSSLPASSAASTEPNTPSSAPPSSFSAPSAASGASPDTSSYPEAPPPFSGREDGVTSMGFSYNYGQSMYWFTAEEATGFMKLFDELQYAPYQFKPNPPGFGPEMQGIQITKEDGDEIEVFSTITGGRSKNSGGFEFLGGQDDKRYALAQYVYSLDGIQEIPELSDYGKYVLDNFDKFVLFDTTSPSE